MIDSPEHEEHMVRSLLRNNGTTRVCPSTHPIPVPTLTVNISFPMPTTSGTVVLPQTNRDTFRGRAMTWTSGTPGIRTHR